MLTCPSCGSPNPAAASFCMSCGAPLGAAATAHEARKTVTVLFCDLVGSTTLAETYDPEVLRPLLHDYFAEMRAAAEGHGGRVEKFIGDAVSVVFGLPTAHEDDALRAVRAGVEMAERLEALNARAAIALACRVGIATGEVLVQAHGEPLIGDAMNTASRLQSSAEPGSIIIAGLTWRLVRDAVDAEPLEPLTLKGKAEPVRAYRVLHVESHSPMRTRRLGAPMVGRTREAALLASAFERVVSDRACQLFTVVGPAGVGKSRLVEEFLGSLDAGDVTVLRGRCLPYGDGITYLPIAEAVREALGLPEFAEVGDVRAAIAEAVAGEDHATALEANLAPLFAAGPAGSPEETAWAIRRFLESRGRARPVVLVLDDIHWGEPAFLDLVEHLADRSRDGAMLLLAMARPDLLDARPDWGGSKTNATTISLAPLTDDECARLIAFLLGSAALPDEIPARITPIAGGNPLFVEEILRMLVDDELLVRNGDAWIAARDLADVAVPPTIAALLSARLDRLSEDERASVEAASVEGQGFHRGAVAALLSARTRMGLDKHLRSLVGKELISPERSSLPGEDAYRFRHLLIRDAAYDAIPKSVRSELHRAFAAWLEGTAGDRVAEQQEIVGYHLERAYRYRQELGLAEDRELRLRAGRALAAAGSRAVDGGDARAAVDLLRPAVDLLEGEASQLPALSYLADGLEGIRDYHAQIVMCERLERAAVALGDASYGFRGRKCALDARTTLEPGLWDPQTERRLAEEAFHLAREQGDDHLLPYAIDNLAGSETMVGHRAASLELGEELLRLAQRRGLRMHLGVAVGWISLALEYGTTPLTTAMDRIEEFITNFGGDRSVQRQLLSTRAKINAWLGRTEDVASDIAASRSIGQELGRPDTGLDTVAEGYATWIDRGPAAAEELFANAHRVILERGEMILSDFSGVPLARVRLDLGREVDAVHVIDDLRRHTVIQARIQSRTMSSVVAARRGDLDEALRLSAEAEDIAAATDCLIDQADVALDRAEVLLLAGHPDAAQASAADALERFERKEFAIGIRRARRFPAALPD